MSQDFGQVPANSTLPIYFATYGGTNGESITCTGLAVTDIEIYKNGSVTQRSSDSGYTLLDTDGIDFDGITGIHGFSIDLSDNTDAGFYAVGSFYAVIVSAITVDSQTVNFIAATFRIGPAETVTGYQVVDAGAVSGDATAADNLEAACDGTTYNIGGGAVVAASVTGAVGSVTGNVGGNVAGSVGSVTGAVGSVTGDVGGNVTGSVGSLAAQAKADVNAEVDSALDTAIPGVPTANSINERIQTMDDADMPGSLTTLLSRVSATIFSGITSLAEWLGAAFGKQAPDATAQTEIRATGAGSGTFDPTTDSLEAIRDTEPLGTAMRGTDSAATAAGLATAQADLDLLTGADGATLATSQPNYAPATAASLATAQADLDLLTGADGATLATSQPNYAPATAAALTTHDGKLDVVDTVVDAILADTGTDGVALSAAQKNSIADYVLRRSLATALASADGDAKAFRSLAGAVSKLVNKIALSGSTLTVYEDDDTTALGTQTATTNASADPVTALDTD